jgi:peptidoglycan/xylan/chitin deacetylase (PgdA/CDA1 family)
MVMRRCAHICNCLRRLFLFFVACLSAGVVVSSAHAFQVADGMLLLRQEMPANYCALTFDDGPGPSTATLLDLLAERGIVATFFVLGQNAERRPTLIRRMLVEGHEVANHGYSHTDMRRLKPEAQFLEMKKTLDVLQNLGAEVRYFRPPYGYYVPETTAKAEELGMTVMLWSLDSQDWRRHASRLERLRSVSPTMQQSLGMRGVFLFHDTHKNTVENMPYILDTLIAGGCERFVTVSEYMTRVPHEEEKRLSTQAPHGGRGEIPPPALAESMGGFAVGGVPLWVLEDTRGAWANGVGMRTHATHSMQRDGASLRMHAAHGHAGESALVAVPEMLALGVATNGQPASFPLARAIPQPYASVGAQGPRTRLLSEPGMILPAHKPSRGRPDGKRDGSGPG